MQQWWAFLASLRCLQRGLKSAQTQQGLTASMLRAKGAQGGFKICCKGLA